MKPAFYTGRDNYYTLALTLDGVAYDLTEATDIELKHSKGSIKRSTTPAVFDADGTNVRINLGEADLPSGSYSMYIIIYSLDWPNGMVWGKEDVVVFSV